MCGLKSQSFFGKVIALRILVSLARAIRRQIGNTGLGGCNRRPLEKRTAFKFCLLGAAPNKESSFYRNKFDYYIATDLSTKHIPFALKIFLFLFNFGFKSIISVLDWVESKRSFKYVDIIRLC